MARCILISAYGCEPGKGSEQGVGWHWVLEMAKIQELWVITRSNNRLGIEGAFPSEFAERVHFIYYDLPPVLRRFKRKEKGLYFYYALWQWGAYLCAKKLAAEVHFDYCQHLTFGSMWMPIFMHRLPIPLIWGPIGGGEAVPFRLIQSLPVLGRIAQYLRYILMATLPINPLIMKIVRRSRFILARTEDTAQLIPVRYREKVKVVLETGITEDFLSSYIYTLRDRTEERLRVIYTGRLVAFKNVATAIHAVARAKDRGCHLHFVVVGDGPLRKSLQALANELGLSTEIEFRGSISQSKVIEELHHSDVYLFPSLREGGAWSLMEAMSVGLPVICVKTSGMAVMTSERTAIRVEPVSQEYMIDQFAQALIDLAKSPALRRELGENARKRIEEHFRWYHKGEFMRDLFKELESAS